MVLGLAKRIFGGAVKEVKADYSGNKDFLEAVCAAAALVAAADGDIEDCERQKIQKVITNHPKLGKMYKSTDIEATSEAMFKRAKDKSGRQQLARELEDIKGRPDATQMAEDVYLIAEDIANADGEIEPVEQDMLAKIASKLGVDPKNFQF
jgi:tellurite resistance protein